jgi:hypothetical protein
MKKMTIIGNCQANALSKFLLSNSTFSYNYEYIEIKPIFLMNEDELNYLYIYILPILDLIIIQPISEEFNNNNIKYSTKTILNNIKFDCTTIIFPSLYFDFYHPYLCYLNDENTKISEPMDYHDKILINLYLSNKDLPNDSIIKRYLNIFNNNILLNQSMIENNLINSLQKVHDKELKFNNFGVKNTKYIYSYEYIKNNYNKNLLFYSINHPSKHLLQYISDEILNYLNIKLEKYSLDIDPFDNIIIPIYKTLSIFLQFDISIYNNMINNNDIYNEYINIYRNIPDNIFKNNKFF